MGQNELLRVRSIASLIEQYDLGPVASIDLHSCDGDTEVVTVELAAAAPLHKARALSRWLAQMWSVRDVTCGSAPDGNSQLRLSIRGWLLLPPGGQVIVTVPFGIPAEPDLIRDLAARKQIWMLVDLLLADEEEVAREHHRHG